MIELYYFTTPNGRKITMALEELDLPYEVRWIDITRGEQHTPEFQGINPNGKIPAIIDHDGPGGSPITLFESGAILEYLADKTGRLLPTDPASRWAARCWLYWQVANQGPMLGQAAHFVTHAANHGVDDEYGRTRYVNEAKRCYSVLDRALSDREWLAEEFSVADIACFPWTRMAKGQGVDIVEYPNVRRWSDAIAERPSAKVSPPDLRDDATRHFQYTDEQWAQLFGLNSAPQRPSPRVNSA